jgi:hypothetical protein
MRNVTHEDNDFINPVDEFGRKVGSYRTHHKLPCLGSHRPFTHVVQIRRTKVASHHNDCIAKVNDTALTICEATIIEDLQE